MDVQCAHDLSRVALCIVYRVVVLNNDVCGTPTVACQREKRNLMPTLSSRQRSGTASPIECYVLGDFCLFWDCMPNVFQKLYHKGTGIAKNYHWPLRTLRIVNAVVHGDFGVARLSKAKPASPKAAHTLRWRTSWNKSWAPFHPNPLQRHGPKSNQFHCWTGRGSWLCVHIWCVMQTWNL